MVVACYPGAGGNRYLRMSKKLDWKGFGRSYDDRSPDQFFGNRYLEDPNYVDDDILTHNMDYKTITKYFPSHEIVFILGDLKKCLRREWLLAGHQRYQQKHQIISEFDRVEHYRSYRDHAWPNVYTINELQALPQQILNEVNADYENLTQSYKDLKSITKELIVKAESAHEMITWHLEYYKRFPLDFSGNCRSVIDIENDDVEFARVMKQELDLYHSDIFDEVWSSIT